MDILSDLYAAKRDLTTFPKQDIQTFAQANDLAADNYNDLVWLVVLKIHGLQSAQMPPASTSAPTISYLESLPNEILWKLLLDMDYSDLQAVCLASQRLADFCQDEHFWEKRYKKYFKNWEVHRKEYHPDKMPTWRDLYNERELLEMNYDDLLDICSSSKRLADFCQDEHFWEKRYKKYFPDLDENDDPEYWLYHIYGKRVPINWKEVYNIRELNKLGTWYDNLNLVLNHKNKIATLGEGEAQMWAIEPWYDTLGRSYNDMKSIMCLAKMISILKTKDDMKQALEKTDKELKKTGKKHVLFWLHYLFDDYVDYPDKVIPIVWSKDGYRFHIKKEWPGMVDDKFLDFIIEFWDEVEDPPKTFDEIWEFKSIFPEKY